MADLPEILSGSFYRSFIDVAVGTIAPSVIETVFDMLQKQMTINHFFAFMGISPKTNKQVVRLLRILLEPPILISSVVVFESAFVQDPANVGVFLPIVVQYNIQRYFEQLAYIKGDFIDWLESMEEPKPPVDQV